MPVTRSAAIVAAAGLAAGVAGAVVATLVFRAHSTGRDSPLLLLWMILPLALGGVAIAAMRTRSVGFVWVTVGALLGFVVISGFSFGPFFVWEGLAILAAALVHLENIRPRWKMLLTPLWFVAGASGICVPFLMVTLLRGATFGGGMSGPRREGFLRRVI